MEIRLYREQPSPQRAGKPVVARLWDYLLRQRTEAAAKRPTKKPPAAPKTTKS
jgi:hypothetical protein